MTTNKKGRDSARKVFTHLEVFSENKHYSVHMEEEREKSQCRQANASTSIEFERSEIEAEMTPDSVQEDTEPEKHRENRSEKRPVLSHNAWLERMRELQCQIREQERRHIEEQRRNEIYKAQEERQRQREEKRQRQRQKKLDQILRFGAARARDRCAKALYESRLHKHQLRMSQLQYGQRKAERRYAKRRRAVLRRAEFSWTTAQKEGQEDDLAPQHSVLLRREIRHLKQLELPTEAPPRFKVNIA